MNCAGFISAPLHLNAITQAEAGQGQHDSSRCLALVVPDEHARGVLQRIVLNNIELLHEIHSASRAKFAEAVNPHHKFANFFL